MYKTKTTMNKLCTACCVLLELLAMYCLLCTACYALFAMHCLLCPHQPPVYGASAGSHAAAYVEPKSLYHDYSPSQLF